MSDFISITHLTRRNIVDYIRLEQVVWSGELDDTEFILRVWPDAADLPSHDPRFTDAVSDIWQHRINNYDWDDDWIFVDPRFNLTGGADDQFLAFLAETVHPFVRFDQEEVAKLVTEFNRQLRPDGFKLQAGSSIGGRPIYFGTRISSIHSPSTALNLSSRNLLDDHTALMDNLGAIERDLTSDPAGAIASAKDLVETICKIILDRRGVAYGHDDLPKLYKKVAVELGLAKESVPASAKGSEAAHKTLGGLGNTVQGLAELRNQIGRGHGRSSVSPALERHARLAFNAAVALTEFLYDTLQDREAEPAPNR